MLRWNSYLPNADSVYPFCYDLNRWIGVPHAEDLAYILQGYSPPIVDKQVVSVADACQYLDQSAALQPALPAPGVVLQSGISCACSPARPYTDASAFRLSFPAR